MDRLSELPTETIFNLALNLPFKDILNYCNVSTKFNEILCNTPFFWKRKLKRDFGFDYFGSNSRNIYDQIYRMHPINRLRKAAMEGNWIAVNKAIKAGAKAFNSGMDYAARGNHKDLVEYFISLGANNFYRGLNGAVIGKNKNLIDYFIEKGADKNLGLIYAAENNDKELVDYFIEEKGADDIDAAWMKAADKSHNQLVDYIEEKYLGGLL